MASQASTTPFRMMRRAIPSGCSGRRASLILQPRLTSSQPQGVQTHMASRLLLPRSTGCRLSSTARTSRPGVTRATALSATSTPSHYSTGSPAPGPSAPASATPSPTSPPPAKPNNADGDLDWNTFFRLRRVRRWHNLIASVFTSSGSTVVAVGILSQFDIDTFGNQVFGLDPILFMGLLTVSSGAFGWLAGPSLGNVLFGLRHKRHKAQLDLKEKELYARIKRYRVDPSAQSMNNPVPDYYGEKISSIDGYRQWLKDQKIYDRKRLRGIV